MKQLLTFFLITIFFCSCSLIKKSTNKAQTHSDSTGSKSSVLFDVKKKDSVGTGVVKTTETKTSDNNYTKTTTTKEFYTDEFDFEGPVDTLQGTAIDPKDYFPYVKPQGKARKAGNLLYRETTTKEVGTLQTKEGKEQLSKQKSDVSQVDATVKKEDQKTQVTKDEKKVSKWKDVTRLLPGIGAILFVLILLYIGYRYYKKTATFKN